MLTSREKGIYLTINADGKFAQKVDPSTPGAKSRVNTENGKTYHELFFDELEGFIENVKFEDSQYGMRCKVFFIDGEQKAILTMGYSSMYLIPFLKMFPSIDVTKKVKLSPSVKEEDGKKKSSLFMKQDIDGTDQIVPYAYKADNKNGMPDRVLIKVKGKDTWDYTPQIEFLAEKALEKIGAAPHGIESFKDTQTTTPEEDDFL